ncbi:hypothetical protein TPHA_0E03560 [Tetrapisispora phaffii CBS 4417]|uniref:Ribosomal RNA-processing protein 43 n=1 Tax=Tetrapisispora phaffii (strain ATCC 24235 / CBS 4417 / NBRC 1672 / NRRL Y-8282 / UCD 70-5) TaxID=1071381 RepID=G8BU68_TETPH|nr:hypothetical protein TPHA_0E03560 [Tetrapisispora phaffii CBS 4417]CCE63446.1 hypothetical protein TPHA_0E03560 [Tetrapisispora phaffii CBS 4417]
MNSIENSVIDVKPLVFPKDVLARISPDLILQRYLSLNLRPSIRSFDEFRDISVSNIDDIENEFADNVLGTNILKCGKTIIITTITASIIKEENQDETFERYYEDISGVERRRNKVSEYGSVYPVVEIERGRGNAPPSDEEMNIGQKLHDNILHSGLISKKSLKVDYGVRITDLETNKSKIIYPEEDEINDVPILQLNHYQKNLKYVLHAKITVFSRTGPLFDLCWNSLTYALQNTKLPKAFIDEKAVSLKTIIRSRGKTTELRENFNIICDTNTRVPLQLNKENIAYASNYGIVDLDYDLIDTEYEEKNNDNDKKTVLLADINTESEEEYINSSISIITNKYGNLKNIIVLGGTSKISMEILKKSISLSKIRAHDLESKA